jgi:DNA-binding CsgD family transcriptional regulator
MIAAIKGEQITGGSYMLEPEELENSPFIGRQPENQWFRSQMAQTDFSVRVLNVFGTGGIGKSSLLEQYRSVAEQNGIPFLLLDSREFPHTASGFFLKLLEILHSGQEGGTGSFLVETAVNRLNQLAEKRRFILAIDTYEELLNMDSWLRNHFFPMLTGRILLILSGRYRLTEEWSVSPFIRRFIHFMPLRAFDPSACAEYAALHGNQALLRIDFLHAVSHGHPLTLSLFIQKPEMVQEFNDGKSLDLAETLKIISSRWLRELPSPAFQSLVEAASTIRIFNQESLEYMLQMAVNPVDFDRLTALSFIRRSRRGWFIHDGLRKALLLDFKLRKPQQFQRFQLRAMAWLYQQFKASRQEDEKALLLFDLLYLTEGESAVRATFMDESEDHHYYFKTIQADSIGEMHQYMQKVLNDPSDIKLDYIDPRTLKQHTLEKSHDFIKKAYSLIDADQFLPLGSEVIRLLINDKGESAGLVVFLPIHRESLPLLQKNACSRHYFTTLSPEQLSDLATSPVTPAGWFLYHIDFIGDPSAAARQLFFQMFTRLLIQGGLFVISSPLDYYIKVNLELGFREVPAAGHAEFGANLWSTTLELDLRGDRFNSYIENMLQVSGASTKAAATGILSILSSREREVAQMLLECETNAEIAAKLHITEITVKKHLSQIYKKTEVKNRFEYMKKLIGSDSVFDNN